MRLYDDIPTVCLSETVSVIVAWAVNILQISIKYRRPVAVSMVVSDCGKCSKYFATIAKIPTDGFRQYGRRYLCHTFTCFVGIAYLSSCANV